MTRYRNLLLGLVVAVAGCGGSDDDGNPMGPGLINGTFTATVDGTAFSATTSVIAAYVSNTLVITATSGSGANAKSFSLTVQGVTGTGTFSLVTAGSAATYSETTNSISQSWLCASTQGSGTVTLSQLSATKAVGTFTFIAPANTISGATGTKAVTAGSFNITVTNPQ